MFIGIPLPAAQREFLARALNGFPLPEEDFRRSRPEGWHITLQFLGEVRPRQHESLVSRLEEVSSKPARIRIAEIGWMGAGILAAHVEPAPELTQLAENVAAATRLCGFQPEERLWRPHVTLARRKQKRRASRSAVSRLRAALEEATAQMGTAPGREFLAREFCLFESFSDPQGQRYNVRARFPMEQKMRSPDRA